MTTITIDRTTVEQALEALEDAARCVQENYLPDQCGHDWDEQITALRAALAQQAERTPPDATAGLVDDLCLLHMGWKADAEDDLYRAAWGRVIARAKQLKAQVGKGEEK